MRTRDGLRFNRHLNVALSETPFWKTLFDVFDDTVERTVSEQLEQLSNLRSALHIHRGDWITVDGQRMQVAAVDFGFDDTGVFTTVTAVDARGNTHTTRRRAIQDRNILIASARQLGFDYFSDTLSDMSYVQLIESLAEFWPRNGSHDLIDFIGFIKQTRLDMHRLWDDETIPGDEYAVLEARDRTMVPVWEGGGHYPTSHYEMVYDYLSNTTIDLADLVKLFYVFAPINFVLHRVVGEVVGEDTLLTTTAAGALGYHDSALLDYSQDISGEATSVMVPTMGAVVLHSAAVLYLPLRAQPPLFTVPIVRGAAINAAFVVPTDDVVDCEINLTRNGVLVHRANYSNGRVFRGGPDVIGLQIHQSAVRDFAPLDFDIVATRSNGVVAKLGTGTVNFVVPAL